MGYYDGYSLEGFQSFDADLAYSYVGEGEGVVAFGETDDMCHWAIAEVGRDWYKAYLHKPTYVMGEQTFDDQDWRYDTPLWVEEFDNPYDAFEFVSNNVGHDW